MKKKIIYPLNRFKKKSFDKMKPLVIIKGKKELSSETRNRRARRQWHLTPVLLPGKSPWTEEPGGLQSMGLLRVGHD